MAAFMGRVEGHRGESREIEGRVHAGLEPLRDEERLDLVTDGIASGANLEIGYVRKVGRRRALEPCGNFDLRGGDWHPSATPLDAIVEAA